jgi:hypothetical protein
MSNRGMIVIQSCVGSAFLTGLIGAFYFYTWIQFLLAFLIFAVILFFRLQMVVGERNSN